ncbi:MAG TPA: hypothetical protein PL156_10390 [Rhodoglobus sp.]|nr:hypothetical protein [Rhodoglobus sp.]
MATGDGVTEWIDVADFTPGIHSGTRSFQTGLPESAVDGVAQERDTWGCVANPNGGLEPAPAIAYRHQDDLTKITVAGHTPTEFSYENDPAGTYEPIPGAARGVRILDFAVVQQTFHEPYETDADGFVSNPPDTVVLLAHQRYHKITSDRFANRLKAKTYPMNKLDEAREPTFAVEQLMDDRVEGIRFWGIGNIIAGRSASDIETGDTDALLYPHRARIALCMSYWDWPDGDPYSDTGTPSPYGVQWVQITQQFPPISGVFPAKYVASSPIRMVYHQNRIVYSIPTPKRPEDGFFVITRDTFGSAIDDLDLDTFEDLFSDELLNYLAVYEMNSINDWDSRNKVYVDSGRPDMIGALISYDTTQLFIIKAQGGGVIVRDSMERPTVSRYPGVESTGYYPHKPVLVPTLGVVYGGVGGVFAWNGGNQSQQLSASLDGTFWLTPENRDRAEGTDEVIGVISPRKPETGVGKFAYLHPYIYTPNNWIMDVRTGGWFRLHPTRELESTDGLDLAYFDVASSGRVYAAEDIQRDTDLAFVQINPKQGSPKFSWRSQPMARQLRGRQLEFKELNVVLSGRGTVKFTLVGINGEEEEQTIEVDHDRPHLFVKKYDLRAYDIEVLIESEGVEKYLDDTYEIDGTLTIESAQFVGGSSVSGSLASSISGAKHPAPMRISTGVTFNGLANVPGALAIPADSDPGWTTFGTAKTLSYSFSTPNSGINGGGIITAYIHRYDIQTSGGTHLGYLYKQAYYNASMVEVGHGSPNSGAKPIWLSWRPIPGNEQSGGGAFVGPVTQFSNRTFQIGHVEPGVIDTTEPVVAPTVHRYSLGYKTTSVANRN